MTNVHDHVVEQFSGVGSRGDIWRGFDLFLPTGQYLNLGYSGSGQSHLVGSPQGRLVEQVGLALEDRLPRTDAVPLIDLGCGRGGPAVRLRRQFGFDVTGLDLVPYNVAMARENAREAGFPAEFVVGDATRAPFAADSFRACTAIDAFVYVPDKASAFAETARVLREGGWLVCSDLVREDDPEPPSGSAEGAPDSATPSGQDAAATTAEDRATTDERATTAEDRATTDERATTSNRQATSDGQTTSDRPPRSDDQATSDRQTRTANDTTIGPSPEVDAFAEAWDMAPVRTLDRYLETVEGAGLEVVTVRDISANSVRRFEKWARLYLGLADRFEAGVRRVLDRWDLDFETVTEQVRRAHVALPHLRHVVVCARR